MSLEVQKLNDMSVGKVVKKITYNEDGMDYLVIYFSDGSKVVLSTLGGVEIENAAQQNVQADGAKCAAHFKYFEYDKNGHEICSSCKSRHR